MEAQSRELTAQLSAVAGDVRCRQDELVELASALVRAPSPNPPGDERAVAALVRDYMNHPRITSVTHCRADTRPNVIFEVGQGSPTLLMSAHTDTVAFGSGWTVSADSGEIRHGRIYGRGSTDNKGAVAAMAVAMRALVELGLPESGRLIFIANADEEAGGTFGMGYIADVLGSFADAAVVAEPSGISGPFECLWTGARGACRFTVTIAGEESHSSLVETHDRPNPISDIGTVATTLPGLIRKSIRKRHGSTAGWSVTPVLLTGGRGWNVFPGGAELAIDLRVPPGAQQEVVELIVNEAVGSVSASLKSAVSLAFDERFRWLPPTSLNSNHPLLKAAEAAWGEVLRRPPTRGLFPGGTDARSLAKVGVPAIPGLGPGALCRAHRPDEYVTVDELGHAARIYAMTALRFLTNGAEA